MKFYVAILLILSLLFSCQKEPVHYDSGSNEAINQWIVKNMDDYYFWKINQSGHNLSDNPIQFFQNLLYKDDHYSTIVQNMNLASYKNNFETSFGFDFIQVKREGSIQAIVTLVVPGSQAEEMGLKRGDVLVKINDLNLNEDISSSVEQILNGNSLNLIRKDGKEFKLASAYIAQPGIYKAVTIEVDNKKFGYLYLSHFNFDSGYDLIREIQKFKTEQVKDVILDLRYNPGGQVSYAAFCALLLGNVNPTDRFVQMVGNSKVGKKEYSFIDALSTQPDGYSFKAEDIKSKSLNLSRIYILSSKQSASASELMINNLQPYMDVIQIGESTMGKDMASINIASDNETSGNGYKWIMSPLVYQLFNSKGEGNYKMGLKPQININEFSAEELYPFGDIRDPLIQAAFHGEVKLKAGTRNEPTIEVVYRSKTALQMVVDEI